MSAPEVFEMAGVKATAGLNPDYVHVREQPAGIAICTVRSDVVFTVAEARRLADQLYALADRVEKRMSLAAIGKGASS